MKTLISRNSLIAALISILLISSCKKENSETQLTAEEEQQASIASTESDAESEVIFNSVFDDVMGVNSEVGIGGVGIFGRTGNLNTNITDGRQQNQQVCFTVSATPLVQGQAFPLKIVIDFGAGCTGPDGRTRYGKIITEYTGRLIMPGKSATTTFEGYKIDSVSIEGTYKITNTSATINDRQFTVNIINAKITKPNGNYITWNTTRVVTQIEGLSSPFVPADDVFSITGFSKGQVKRGTFIKNWESEIIEPLIKRFNCRWIVKGKVKIARQNQASNSPWIGILNYGNGECDFKAILAVNGQEHQILLPH